MAQSTAEQLAEHAAHTGGEGHAPGHAEHPFLAHHFDNPRHQFESGKLGIWLFLVTEVLFFGGLFCAYAIYRSLHPEIFVWAHYYLDTFWGAVNTGVLIVSSLTAAWAVRNAQLGEQKKLVINIIATITLAFCFLCVKYVEYSHKFHENVLPGRHFNPTYEAWELESYKKAHGDPGGPVQGHVARVGAVPGEGADSNHPSGAAPGHAAGSTLSGDPARGNPTSVPGADAPSNVVPGSTAPGTTLPGSTVGGSTAAGSTAAGNAAPEPPRSVPPASAAPGSPAPVSTVPGSVPPASAAPGSAAPGSAVTSTAPPGSAPAPTAIPSPGSAAPGTAAPGGSVPVLPVPAGALPAPVIPGSEAGAVPGTTKRAPPGAPERPHHVSVFFSIYFFMTGLHGVHVVAGIITWLWILRRALRGEFGPQHFGAVDYAALYWHLVDLIWIYLFPLLYLIH